MSKEELLKDIRMSVRFSTHDDYINLENIVENVLDHFENRSCESCKHKMTGDSCGLLWTSINRLKYCSEWEKKDD